MPIRSPRALYEIRDFGVNYDDNPDAVDEAPIETEGGDVREMYAKIKTSIGDYLGLTPLPFDDPFLTGIFQSRIPEDRPQAGNVGSRYRKRLGAFKVASYKLISKTVFEIEEQYYDSEAEEYVNQTANFKTMSIGLPKGHSVNEFIGWMLGWNNLENIAAIVTPKGRRIDTLIRANRG